MICKNRPPGKRGGIAIYIQKHITYKHRPDIEINVENEFESLFIDMSINNKHIIIGEIYRVPNTNEKLSINRYETILKKLHNIKAKVLLATDQNFDYLKIQNHKNTLDLFNHFLSSGFIPTTTVPSRITHTSTTLIDNIYVDTQHDMRLIHSGTLIYDISDHLPIFLFYGKINKHKNKPLFADDTTIFYSTKHLDELYENISFDLNTLSDWFKANKLSLNVNKTNYMIFKNIKTPDNSKIIKIGTEIIEQTSIAKFVGIFIDDQLNWKTHIDYVRNKLSSGLYALNISKHIISRQLLKCLYHTLIHPHLTYGLILWGSTYKKYLHKLEILQNKSIRSITNSKYNDSSGPIYKNLSILPLTGLYELETVKFMYLNQSNELPLPLQTLFTTNANIHGHNTRHRHDPHINTRRTETLSHSFIHKAPALWYTVPSQIKNVKTVGSFRSKIKRELLNK